MNAETSAPAWRYDRVVVTRAINGCVLHARLTPAKGEPIGREDVYVAKTDAELAKLTLRILAHTAAQRGEGVGA